MKERAREEHFILDSDTDQQLEEAIRGGYLEEQRMPMGTKEIEEGRAGGKEGEREGGIEGGKR